MCLWQVPIDTVIYRLPIWQRNSSLVDDAVKLLLNFEKNKILRIRCAIASKPEFLLVERLFYRFPDQIKLGCIKICLLYTSDAADE